MNDEGQLLRRFAEAGDEAAFRELVARHLDLVYSAALRQLNGDTHLAEDAAQTVFADLARKARSLPRGVVLTGWLYEAARFAAAKMVRGEQRRRAREQEAATMHDPAPESTPDWEPLRPVLDTAMGELSATDRNAVLLRFFERKDFRAVGTALGLSEDAAQKRVARALDKLRINLSRHGVTLSGPALAAATAAGAIHSAPAGLAMSVATASLAGASTAVTVGFAANLLQAMATTKIKIIAAATLVAAVGTPLFIQQQANRTLQAENVSLRSQLGGLKSNELAELQKLRAENKALVERMQAEAARQQAEHLDLLRLRSRVTSQSSAENENRQLEADLQTATNLLAGVARLVRTNDFARTDVYLPQNLRDVGTATLDDAAQSSLYVIVKNDSETLRKIADPKSYLSFGDLEHYAEQVRLELRNLARVKVTSQAEYLDGSVDLTCELEHKEDVWQTTVPSILMLHLVPTECGWTLGSFSPTTIVLRPPVK